MGKGNKIGPEDVWDKKNTKLFVMGKDISRSWAIMIEFVLTGSFYPLIWTAVEGSGLAPKDHNGLSDPYIKV